MQRTGDLRRSSRLSAAILVIARRALTATLVAGLLTSSACYNFVAVPESAPLGEQRAEFRITDEGRIQLREQVGPGALTVEGRVVRQDSAGWTLRVYRVATLNGEVSTWSGEVVEVPKSAVAMVQRRDFDRGRTVIATAATVGAVALFVVSRSLLGGGLFGDDGPGEGGGQTQVDIRR